ncbi:hypothetical protein [Hamadaea tsunoensis]|uniref:hypothetical protein n=1 Tax=Hamadaea tsunoensis TaxID=53368 RepID=UPI00041EC10D|nr:hypothetical protein [Hamadaea tsunoensis]
MDEYRRRLRDRFLSAPVLPVPEPWVGLAAPNTTIPVGGLIGVGFAPDPVTGADLLLVASHSGRGLFDPATGARTARDHDLELGYPTGPDLSCAGIGPLAGTRIQISGLFGGGLHTTAEDGWAVDVVAPEWPDERVLLSGLGSDIYRGTLGVHWWHIFHSRRSELRAAGFSPSGRTLVVATSSDVTLWHRP